MRRTAWIWLVGCVAWTVDAVANAFLQHLQHAQLAALLAVLFAIAWLFYRGQRR